MGRTGITKEQVYEAAAALSGEGISPTVQSVRERIGTGSYSTISGYLTAWRDEHAAQVPANIPDRPEKVEKAFEQVWATAALAAQEGVDIERKALEDARREMEQERAEMKAEIERLEQAVDEGAGENKRLTDELEAERRGGAEKDERIHALTVENARLDERLNAAVARGDELKGQLERLEDTFATASRAAPKSRATTRKAKTKADAEANPASEHP